MKNGRPVRARCHIRSLPGVVRTEDRGETSYFYNPDDLFARGTDFATIKAKDGQNDRASHLDRGGVWRLNMGVSRGAFVELFGPPPARPTKGGVVEGPWDFTAADTLTPHPVYGWISWVAVSNPGRRTWVHCAPLLEDAHARARSTFETRVRSA